MRDDVVLGLAPAQLRLTVEQFFARFSWDGTRRDLETLPASDFFTHF